MKKDYLLGICILIIAIISCSKSEPPLPPPSPPTGASVSFKVHFVVEEFQTPAVESLLSNVWLVISKGSGADGLLLKQELAKNGDYYTAVLDRAVVSDENCRFYFIANADLIQNFNSITRLEYLQAASLPEIGKQTGIQNRYVMATKSGYKPVITNEAIVIEKISLTPTVTRLAFEYRNQLTSINKIRILGTLQRGTLQGFIDSDLVTNPNDQVFTITDDQIRFSESQGETGFGYCDVYPVRDNPVKIEFEVNGQTRAVTLPSIEKGATYPVILRYGVLLAYQANGSVEYSGDGFLFPTGEVWLDIAYEEGGVLGSNVDWLSFENATMTTKGMSITTKRLHCEANLTNSERVGNITLRGVDGEEEVFNISQRGEVNNPAGIEYVEIPAGSFMMGSPVGEMNRDEDETQHQVTLSKGFGISKYEITNVQFCRFLNALKIGITGIATDGKMMVRSPKEIEYIAGSWQPRAEKGAFPIVNVTYYGAQAFAQWAGGALPTEAQWEYACRGSYENKSTEVRTKPFGVGNGDELNRSLGNFFWRFPYRRNDGEYLDSTAEIPVATTVVGGVSASVNNYGIYDMHGNVWEWCSDHYHASYGGSNGGNPATDPKVFIPGAERVLRGGSWYYYARSCRSAFRMRATEETVGDHIGFRIVRL